MEFLFKGTELTEEDLASVRGGDACAREYCGSDANCGLLSNCTSGVTYYGCSGGVLFRPIEQV